MRRKIVRYKKVDVIFNGGNVTIVEAGAKKPSKVEHPCLTNFNADNIDPDILGTGLDEVTSELMFDGEHHIHAPDPFEERLPQRSGGEPINLFMRMRA